MKYAFLVTPGKYNELLFQGKINTYVNPPQYRGVNVYQIASVKMPKFPKNNQMLKIPHPIALELDRLTKESKTHDRLYVQNLPIIKKLIAKESQEIEVEG